jgi:uncharacterized protein YndB with AHSA1/START domain
MSGRSKPNEIRITRVYDAPVRMVWDAWTDPEKVGKWWGPRGFTLTTKSKELRPGGRWIYTMHGPDGTDYPNIATYHEVVPMKRLVYDHGGNEERQKLFTVTATFSESDGKTTLDMTMAFDTAAIAAESRVFIKKAGGNGTWDRLAEFLEEEGGRRRSSSTAASRRRSRRSSRCGRSPSTSRSGCRRLDSAWNTGVPTSAREASRST